MLERPRRNLSFWPCPLPSRRPCGATTCCVPAHPCTLPPPLFFDLSNICSRCSASCAASFFAMACRAASIEISGVMLAGVIIRACGVDSSESECRFVVEMGVSVWEPGNWLLTAADACAILSFADKPFNGDGNSFSCRSFMFVTVWLPFSHWQLEIDSPRNAF